MGFRDGHTAVRTTRVLSRACVVILLAAVAALLSPVSQDAEAHPGHPVKSLHVHKWYQRYEDSYNYATWMTLRGRDLPEYLRHELANPRQQRTGCVQQFQHPGRSTHGLYHERPAKRAG